MLGSDRDGAIGSTNDGTFVIEGIGVPSNLTRMNISAIGY